MKILKIKSKAKHYSTYKKPGAESIKYPNLIYLRPSYALNYKTLIEYRTQQGFK